MSLACRASQARLFVAAVKLVLDALILGAHRNDARLAAGLEQRV
jgi:hypothetical protein